MIEPAAINGQKGYHNDLEKAMKGHIEEHKADFLPDGFGVDDQAEAAAAAAAAQAEEERLAAERKAKEEQDKALGKGGATAAGEGAERKKKLGGLGAWALDTLEGAFEVGSRSASGAIELLKDALDALLSIIPGFNSASGNRLLYVVILLLVLSNVWTLMRVGNVREESALRFGRREADRQKEDAEKERWVQSIVHALWDELEAGGATIAKKVAEPLPPAPAQTTSGNSLEEWKAELEKLSEMMGLLEQRIEGVKVGLEAAQLQLTTMD